MNKSSIQGCKPHQGSLSDVLRASNYLYPERNCPSSDVVSEGMGPSRDDFVLAVFWDSPPTDRGQPVQLRRVGEGRAEPWREEALAPGGPRPGSVCAISAGVRSMVQLGSSLVLFSVSRADPKGFACLFTCAVVMTGSSAAPSARPHPSPLLIHPGVCRPPPGPLGSTSRPSRPCVPPGFSLVLDSSATRVPSVATRCWCHRRDSQPLPAPSLSRERGQVLGDLRLPTCPLELVFLSCPGTCHLVCKIPSQRVRPSAS